MKYLQNPKPAFDPITEQLVPHYEIQGCTFVTSWTVERKIEADGYVPDGETPSAEALLVDRVINLESVTDDLILLMADSIGGI